MFSRGASYRIIGASATPGPEIPRPPPRLARGAPAGRHCEPVLEVSRRKRAGAEVVQLYIQDIECSVERPLKELKGFDKILIEPGQKKTVDFEIMKLDLSFFDEKERKWKVENGEFKVLIGSSSDNIKLEDKFTYSN